MGGSGIGGNGPSAAVDEKNRSVHGGDCHGNIVEHFGGERGKGKEGKLGALEWLNCAFWFIWGKKSFILEPSQREPACILS
jgi:hypothetical protein